MNLKHQFLVTKTELLYLIFQNTEHFFQSPYKQQKKSRTLQSTTQVCVSLKSAEEG